MHNFKLKLSEDSCDFHRFTSSEIKYTPLWVRRQSKKEGGKGSLNVYKFIQSLSKTEEPL